MFDLYVVGGIAAVVAVFLGMFKYRGSKIKTLESDKKNLETSNKAHKDKADLMEKVNEVHTEPSNHDAAVERLLKRARANKNK